MKISNCCGAPATSTEEFDYEIMEMCSKCGEYCEYIEEDEDDFTDYDTQ